jgi:ABC-2 type transport system ATP-binding protein
MEEAERLCDRVAIIEHGRIIDVDSPQRLVDRHCPDRRVVLTTDDPIAEERFRSLAHVASVTRDGGEFTINGRGDGFITEVIQCLAEHRVRVTAFRAEQPNLEDVFLKLTGHSIRD